MSPLLIAAEKGHVEIVEILLTYKEIDINIASKTGQNAALHIASCWSKKEHEEIVKLLLSHEKFDINAPDEVYCD